MEKRTPAIAAGVRFSMAEIVAAGVDNGGFLLRGGLFGQPGLLRFWNGCFSGRRVEAGEAALFRTWGPKRVYAAVERVWEKGCSPLN